MRYDCFTFFNELDLLELRLHELDPVVDRFVLVEATHTFSGKPKKLFFKENQERFRPFLEKIIHVVVDDLPKPNGDAFEQEAHQRNAIKQGLKDCRPEDYILISDVDEIPHPKALKKFQGEIGVLRQKLYYYKFNCQSVTSFWQRSILLRHKHLTTPQAARDLAINFEKDLSAAERLEIVPKAGWHFSYLGSPEFIQKKIQAFSHQEFNTPEYTDPVVIEKNIQEAGNLFHDKSILFRYVKLDPGFPQYLMKNQERFAPFIKALTEAEEILLAKEKLLLNFIGETNEQLFALRQENYLAKRQEKLLTKRQQHLEQKIAAMEKSLRWRLPNALYNIFKR